MEWTTPASIQEQLQRYWDSGRFLSAESSLNYPLKLRFRKPDGKALSVHFDEVRQWIQELEAGSKSRLGFGYEIEWKKIQHRSLGHNRVPAGILIPTEDDALRLIGRKRESERFWRLAEESTKRFPAL